MNFETKLKAFELKLEEYGQSLVDLAKSLAELSSQIVRTHEIMATADELPIRKSIGKRENEPVDWIKEGF